MDNYDIFLGKLYDILLSSSIISYDKKARDLKEKKERIEKYLDKLDKVQRKAVSKEVYLNILKEFYYDRYIIKKENIPDSYFKSLEKRYLDEGHGYLNLVNPNNVYYKSIREEHINVIISEQKESLDSWLNYFLSKESDYLPMWAKVWAFQGMLGIGNLNKDKDGYTRRSNTAVNPFVSLDSEILGKCVELVKETFDNKKITDKEIDKLVSSGSFQKLYGKLLANKKKLKVLSNEGIWVKYNYESEDEANRKLSNGIEPEYLKLYNSLQGYNTGWCTAASKEITKSQICGGKSYLGGDFYVFYTKDENNEYKIPRIAIRMDKNKIGEIRGIAEKQNIETNMEVILEEKLKEFPDGNLYQNKVHDMKKLTEIYNEYLKRELTKEELIFLYEKNRKISGFGYAKDPRIAEIKKTRDRRKDLPIVFDCDESKIGYFLDDLFSRQLIYYDGDIYYNDYKKLRELNLNLPQYVSGNLHLGDLSTANDLVLPQNIGGNLYLGGLLTTDGLVLPKNIGGNLHLGGLTTPEGLVLPQEIYGYLDLGSLKTAEGLVLPKNIGGYLNLGNVKKAEGLVLPENIGGGLILSGLTTPEGLVLPQVIGDFLNLSGLTTAEGLVLPENIGGFLYLNRITAAENLVLPQNIGGDLYLDALISIEGITLPQYVGGYIHNQHYIYSLEEFKTLQQEKINGKKRVYDRNGYTAGIFNMFLLLIISLLGIILGLIFLNI